MTKPSVLVVDDDDAILTLLSRTLEAAGYEVVTAKGLAEGLTQLESRSFDAVLTDKQMPGGSGLQLIEGLPLKYPEVAVLLMTAHPESGLQRLGIDGYLAKPFRSLDAVRDTLASALERRAMQRQREALRNKLENLTAELRKTPVPIAIGARRTK